MERTQIEKEDFTYPRVLRQLMTISLGACVVALVLHQGGARAGGLASLSPILFVPIVSGMAVIVFFARWTFAVEVVVDDEGISKALNSRWVLELWRGDDGWRRTGPSRESFHFSRLSASGAHLGVVASVGSDPRGAAAS